MRTPRLDSLGRPLFSPLNAIAANPIVRLTRKAPATDRGIDPKGLAIESQSPLRGIEREDVERGQVLAKPGSVTPHKKFLAQVYVLKKEEGGRHKAFFSGYRPQFYIRTMDVTGNITLPEGVEMVMPGDDVNLTVELIVPVALEQGSKFDIREGGLTVGAGVVTKILE